MKTNKTILIYSILVLCFLSWVLPINAKVYKIALVHSYEEGYVDAARRREVLQQQLQRQGVKCKFREYFLNCDEFGAVAEEGFAFLFIDDFTKWGADLVAVLDDQATYSLMACNNPKLRQLPVVFAGVNYPNEKMLGQYPNVTGYADIPDYVSTIRMIERIMGKSRICVINGRTVLDRFIWNALMEQCAGEGFDIYQGNLEQHILKHRTVADVLKKRFSTASTETRLENEAFDTTTIMRFNADSLSLRSFTWAGRGRRTLFLFTKRDYTTVNSAALFYNPCFETINEGFGVLDHKMGGYFVPFETEMKDLAIGISQRLRGEMPVQQVQHSAKQYVVNWYALKRYQIPVSSIPPEYTIMYIPFLERYYNQILYGSVIGGFVLLASIFFLSRSLFIERRRKREVQRNLQYEHETLTLAIEGAATYAWRMDGEGLVFDSQFNEMIHHPQGVVSFEDILVFVHPDERELFRQNFIKIRYLLRHKGQYRCSFAGEYQWWEFRYNTIHNKGYEPVVTGLLQNIQDIKDREGELIKARQLAEHAELKQSFLNNMSHEIRTPLNAIAGFSNMLVSDPDLTEEERQEFVDIINLNTRLLLKLVEDVLELSRIESGALSFNYQKEDVRAMLEGIYQTYRVLVKSPLVLLKDFPDEDVFVYVDSMRLTQVLTNFLNNANKFTQEGSITLGYSYISAKNEVHLFVEDTGIGISSEEQKMIFDRFYKHNEFSQGVGLGLSICMLIVEKLEGRIEVESQEGKGSRFTVVLPCISLTS